MAQAQTTLSQAIQSERRRQLIDATVTAIAEHGLSSLTLARVAALAGMTAGSVNFHFSTKEALLLATLRQVAEEFASAIERALETAGEDPGERLLALVDASLDPNLTEARKIAVWYAFMAESRARADYQKICGERDDAYYATIHGLCDALVRGSARPGDISAEALAYGLGGLIDGLWQEILFEGDGYDRGVALDKARAYLSSVFPWRFRFREAVARDAAPATGRADDGLVYTLPAWVYEDPGFFALEKERLFMRAWQIVCHASDIAEPGSWVSFELMNERAFAVRGRDGAVRAFHNVCPHRAHSVVSGAEGRCPGRLVCPYHGWTYDLDGRRIGVSAPDTFRPHDRNRFGLKPLEVEVYMGFVFIRFTPGGPTVAEHFAPVEEEFARYRTADMIRCTWGRIGDRFWTDTVDVDWKNAVENYVEDYHFPTGHPGLSALMEPDYDRDALPNGLARLSHRMRETPLPGWSVQHYRKLLPEQAHLPESMRRRWTYYALFPNTFFDLFPDKMDFFQMLPLAPGRMRLRGRSYALPGGDRASRAARYLGDRINIGVQDEDNALTGEVQKGLRSSGYSRGILSDKEVLVRHFQDWLRTRIPQARLQERPVQGVQGVRSLETADVQELEPVKSVSRDLTSLALGRWS
jgi:phenylpropionate dioxygenase-like ring-hydroxylating dioxygenase large terminal subunit/AcrR family transcriptional regulator